MASKGLDWIRREDVKNHALFDASLFGTEAPSVMYELEPVVSPKGQVMKGSYTAWITLNNPRHYNSYTTDMVKAVIAGFKNASADRRVVAVVFTAVGYTSWCTGGNTKEYAEVYAKRPEEYGAYMDLFIEMVDAILNCKKPTICRVNGMRVAGGQEIGNACDFTIASDLAVFGQAGPLHGSSPDGGSTDFLPWYFTIEDAMWNCISCIMWSAYKMKRLRAIRKVVPVIKVNGQFVRNPLIITDRYVEDGEIVYGEKVTSEELAAARETYEQIVIEDNFDFELLDAAVNEVVWRVANLFRGCTIKAIDGIRQKKRFFWDITKSSHRHWLAANQMWEGFLGFTAFNTQKQTGSKVIDFATYNRLLGEGAIMDDNVAVQVLPQPKQETA